MATIYDTLRNAVQNGALAQSGMPVFDDFSDQQIHDIWMAIRQDARQAKQRGPRAKRDGVSSEILRACSAERTRPAST